MRFYLAATRPQTRRPRRVVVLFRNGWEVVNVRFLATTAIMDLFVRICRGSVPQLVQMDVSVSVTSLLSPSICDGQGINMLFDSGLWVSARSYL